MWAATGRQKEAWGRLSSVIAQHYSIHRDPKKRRKPYLPHEFNPFYKPPKEAEPQPLTEAQVNELFGD